MRKFPIYFFIESSNRVSQEKLDVLSEELKSLVACTKLDPISLEVVHFSIIVLNDKAEQKIPLKELGEMNIP